jgi:tetratricopeptide (TPR) repeat protein
MKKTSFFTFCLFQAFFCFGQTNFIRGEELFMQNKPQEALVFLENSITEDSSHVKAFLYLGIVYEQLERTDEAIAAYRKILPKAGDLTAYISANLGNAYFQKGNFEYAQEFYSQALASDPAFTSAYLGRANTRIKNGALREAVADYELYLTLEPRSSKRPEIERMVNFIRSEFAAEERQRLLAEEAAREEAERRQRLLDELAASLQSAKDESQGLSSGAENVQAYEGEFELE